MKKIKNSKPILSVLQGLLLLVALAAMFSALVDLYFFSFAEIANLNETLNSQTEHTTETAVMTQTAQNTENTEAAITPEQEFLSRTKPLKPMTISIYAALSLLFLLQAVFTRKKWFYNLVRYGIGSFLFFACVIAFLAMETERACFVSAVFHVMALITDHVFAVIRNHKIRNVVFRVLSVLILILSLTSFAVGSYTTLLLVLLLTIPRIFYYIAQISFSRVKMDVLRKITRKTYAAEILFGLLLLMIAFSIVLPSFEVNMATFWDALWYCFAIVTTIGFGDFAASTLPGRLISVILGIYGIIVVALITSIIVNFYTETKNSLTSGEEDGEDVGNDQDVADTESGGKPDEA